MAFKSIINNKFNAFEFKKTSKGEFTDEMKFFKTLFEKCLTLKQGENFIIDTYFKSSIKTLENLDGTHTIGDSLNSFIKENKLLNGLLNLSFISENYYFQLAYNKNSQFCVVCCHKRWQPKLMLRDKNASVITSYLGVNAITGQKEELHASTTKGYRLATDADKKQILNEFAKLGIDLKKLEKINVIKNAEVN